MSLFTGEVSVKGGTTASGDPLYNRFWLEIGSPLQHQPSSCNATPVQEAAAKELLSETLRRCKLLLRKTHRYLHDDFTSDVGYLGTLLKLQEQLSEKRWCDACHTLCKMVKYYCANDIRTMYTIIGILEEYV